MKIPTDKHITYSQQYRTCSHPACRCHSGQRHGPYWYAFWRENGKLKSCYVGKKGPEDMKETITIERDLTQTYSGLPAPTDWHIIESREDGLAWERLSGERLTVIESVSIREGQRWLHVSIGRPGNKLPTYEHIQIMRKLFVGENRECYHIFPTADRYVNFANVLHLFACLDLPAGILPRMEDEIAPGVLGV